MNDQTWQDYFQRHVMSQFNRPTGRPGRAILRPCVEDGLGGHGSTTNAEGNANSSVGVSSERQARQPSGQLFDLRHPFQVADIVLRHRLPPAIQFDPHWLTRNRQ